MRVLVALALLALVAPLPTALAQNQPPVAAFGVVVDAYDVRVDGSASRDPEGGPLTYDWEWGDGTATVGPIVAAHSYARADNYTLRLIVTDRNGASANASRLVAVPSAAGDLPPTAAFNVTVAGLQAFVDANGTSDPERRLATLTWSWGDGTNTTNAATTRTATHAYARGGAYAITLTARDQAGHASDATQRVTLVVAGGLDANFTLAASGLVVAATPNATDANLTHEWRWGDGDAGASASHAYANAGTYEVTHVVMDASGASAKATRNVTVSAPPATTPTPTTSSPPARTPGFDVVLLALALAGVALLARRR